MASGNQARPTYAVVQPRLYDVHQPRAYDMTVSSPRQMDTTAARQRASTPNLVASLQGSGAHGQPMSPSRPVIKTVLATPTSWAPNGEPDALQAEVARRVAAETRVRELEALVSRLRGRISTLDRDLARAQGKRPATAPAKSPADVGAPSPTELARDNPIDRAISEYLDRNPDFPVSIQKLAPNLYVFGDRGTVYVTQRGEHIVVRVGGGFKSLQVFMDERALMVTRDNAQMLADRHA